MLSVRFNCMKVFTVFHGITSCQTTVFNGYSTNSDCASSTFCGFVISARFSLSYCQQMGFMMGGELGKRRREENEFLGLGLAIVSVRSAS